MPTPPKPPQQGGETNPTNPVDAPEQTQGSPRRTGTDTRNIGEGDLAPNRNAPGSEVIGSTGETTSEVSDSDSTIY